MCSLHLMKPLPLLSLRSLACQLKLSCSQARLDSWTSIIALGRFFASKASKDDEPEQEPTEVDDRHPLGEFIVSSRILRVASYVRG